MPIWKRPWAIDIARAVLVALLVSVLTVLGYDVTISPKPNFGVRAIPGKVTNLYALTLSDDLITGDDTTVGDDITITDKANVDEIVLTAASSITATTNMTLTFTTTNQPLTAGGAVAFSIISGGTTGDILLIHNRSNQTITITDTGTIMLAGNAALGQYDTLMLFFDGTNWLQLSKADN